ncbi:MULTISPECIES: hypothetical protein [Bacillus cereus group]|uniref:hypothetical protein n=1 Tax=Bacillus cereus group TaxID=86661 RepID=UPI0018F49419|nr:MULTISPECIES: hypothetical protein [Bacillus cereus group]MBJ8095586.1 hypothetical protein [Bacillus cereus]
MSELQIFEWLKKHNAPFALKLKVMELFQVNTLLVEMDKERKIMILRKYIIDS